MTTKQIAENVNRDERSVQRWAKKTGDKVSSISDKVSAVGKSGKPADYDLDETIAIIETGMGKNAAVLYRMNAEKNTTEVAVRDDGSLRDAFKMMAQAFNTIAETQRNIDSRVQKIECAIESRKALLPAPAIKPRDHINMLVRKHVTESRMDYRDAWRDLYTEFGYRTNSNPGLCAKNRGMPILDYIETEGQIEVLESVAMEIYQIA